MAARGHAPVRGPWARAAVVSRGPRTARKPATSGKTGPEQLTLRDIPTPVPQDDEILIRVRAFGINRAETYMRRGEWPEIAPVSGIECVGEVEHDPSGRLAAGRKVAAIMGGMGRTRNGSYAELVAVPASNVVPIETDLGWAELAAIPESYATAWSCLVHNLRIVDGSVLLVRGGTSALGQAAINIMPSGVDLSFFGSFMLGTAEFPVAEIPLQEIVDRAARGEYRAKPAKVFPFEQLPEAHRLMHSNGAGGKIVVMR